MQSLIGPRLAGAGLGVLVLSATCAALATTAAGATAQDKMCVATASGGSSCSLHPAADGARGRASVLAADALGVAQPDRGLRFVFCRAARGATADQPFTAHMSTCAPGGAPQPAPQPSPPPPAPHSTPSISCHFPYAWCHLDVNRKRTRETANWIKGHPGTSAGMTELLSGVVCSGIPYASAAKVCERTVSLVGGIVSDEIVQAADRNRCLDVHYGLVPPFFHWITTDGGSGCHDN